MKQDKLEKFMRDHKEAFDVFAPDDQLWANIEKRTKPVRRINVRKALWQIAAGVAIFMASWLIHDISQRGNEDQITQSGELLDQPADERMQVLMEAEVFYTSKINTARDEIFRLSGSNKNLMSVLDDDLVELDEVFKDLKNDLKDNGDNQEVIEAMIQNYRIKLQILEEMLEQLSKNENSEDNNKGYEI